MNPGLAIAVFLLAGGTIGVTALPLFKTGQSDSATALIFMVAGGVGAILYCLFGGTFQWGRTGIPMTNWLGRLLMGGIGVVVLYAAWKVWTGS